MNYPTKRVSAGIEEAYGDLGPEYEPIGVKPIPKPVREIPFTARTRRTIASWGNPLHNKQPVVIPPKQDFVELDIELTELGGQKPETPAEEWVDKRSRDQELDMMQFAAETVLADLRAQNEEFAANGGPPILVFGI